MESYFVEAGRRAHVVWRLDGSYGGFRDVPTAIVNPPGGGSEGVWIEPLRVVDGIDFAIWRPEAGLLRLERYAAAYHREHGISEITYRLAALPALTAAKRVWVPLYQPAVVVDLLLGNDSDQPLALRLFGEARFRLSLGWPLGSSAAPELAFDPSADLVRAGNAFGQAALRLEPAPSTRWLHQGPPELGEPVQAERCWWLHESTLAARGAARVRIILTASPAGSRPPGDLAREVAAQANALLAQRIAHFRRCQEAAPHLASPHEHLNRAFELARPALEDFKHHDPTIGLGYFAGFPAYNFYFAGDAFRVMYGACALGDWDDTREILRTIIRGQRTTDQGGQLRGELWHELSTTGHSIAPNFVTLELPSILLHYLRWSGDLDFIREALPAARLAVEWGDRMLVNGPKQTFADGVREDLSVAGDHLTPALWRLRARRDLAALAEALSAAHPGPAAESLGLDRFWDERRGRFVETIRPDGVRDLGPGFTAWLEPDDDVDPGMLERNLRAELADELALGEVTTSGPAFEERRQARAYYVVERGDRARRLLAAGWSEVGARALTTIADLPFRWPEAGFFPEIASRQEAVADLRGCFHQAWTPAFALVHPIVAGLWGIRPDALRHRLVVAPAAPPDWPDLALDNLRFGEHRLALAWRRHGTGQELYCRHEGPDLTLTLRLRLPDEPGEARLRLEDDSPAPPFRGFGGVRTSWVEADLLLGDGEARSAILDWSPAPLHIQAPDFLERVAAGHSTVLPVVVLNRGSEAADVVVEIVTPGRTGAERLSLGPGARVQTNPAVVAPDRGSGYSPVQIVIRSAAGSELWRRTTLLPVFPPIEVALEGPGAAVASRPAEIILRAANLSGQNRRLSAHFSVSPGGSGTQLFEELSPGEEQELRVSVGMPSAPPDHGKPGADSNQAEVACRVEADGLVRNLSTSIPLAGPGRPLVLYSGFLEPPFAAPDLLVHRVAANYAVRRPDRLTGLLPLASALILTDQQDAVLSPALTQAIRSYVELGGRLLFFCYWSAAWGRGFRQTYCSLVRTDLPELLPLQLADGIGSTACPRLEGPGTSLWSDLPWPDAPPLDFSRAVLRRGARCWARADDGTPLAGEWSFGRGRVVAIGLDCFGFGHGTLVRWPAQPRLLRRALDWLLARRPTRRPRQSPRSRSATPDSPAG